MLLFFHQVWTLSIFTPLLQTLFDDVSCCIHNASVCRLARQKERRRDVQLEDKGGIVTGHQNSFELFHWHGAKCKCRFLGCICLSSNAHQLDRHCLRTQTYTLWKTLLAQALCIFLLKLGTKNLPDRRQMFNPLLPFSPNAAFLLFTKKKRNERRCDVTLTRSKWPIISVNRSNLST